MITVVIPCYNAADYIPRCVSHLELQTRKDFCIVFVDDGSTDNSVAVLNKLKESTTLDITILRNLKNRGPAYSRNEGIKIAQSELITFCDCDDWYDPQYLEVLAGLMEKTDSDIAFCGYKVVNGRGALKERPLHVVQGIISKNEVFKLDVDSLCMMMTRTSLMKKTLLPDLRNGEDVATVSLLLGKARTVAATSDCLYNYFRRNGSASEAPTMKVVDSIIDSFDYTKHHFPTGNDEELEFLGIKNMLYASIITLFTFSYDIFKASIILSQFESEFPNWGRNKYIGSLNLYKRIVLFLLKKRLFIVIKGIALLRSLLSRK